MFDTAKLYAVVMAGGHGERFWPAGRRGRPKQLLPLLGERTMIEETVQRLFPLIAPERILVVTATDFVERIRELLPIPPENVIGEPEGRDTAPCAALAAAWTARRDPGATMVLLPADHVIRPAKTFQNMLCAAAEQAASGSLVTLGVTPTGPATGYGYIHTGEAVAPGFFRALAFREKPDPSVAEKFFRDGNYRWNSGIFIWRVEAIRKAFENFVPDLARLFDRWCAASDFEAELNASFASAPRISIDYAVMEKAADVLVGEVSFYWNDIGSWSALRSILKPDGGGNAVRGRAILLDSSGCVVFGDEETLIGAIGIHDLAVVKSGNAVLVCPLSEEQQVRELVRKLEPDFRNFI